MKFSRTILASLIFGAAVSGSAAMADTLAKDVWAGPGWYDTGDFFGLPMLIAGPFATKEDCAARLNPSDGDDCTYWNSDPEK